MSTTLRRYPFTLLMLTLLIGAGIYGRSHVGPLDVAVHRRVGHSPRLLFDGHWHRPFTSLFFTAGGRRFYISLAMLAVSVGSVELVHGTRRAATTFFGIHFATLLFIAVSIALPLSMLKTHFGELLFDARDVGPSAGYYGCLGLAVAGLSSRNRQASVVAILLILLLRLAWSTLHLPEEGRVMSADLAHLIAFPMGLLSYGLPQTASRRPSD